MLCCNVLIIWKQRLYSSRNTADCLAGSRQIHIGRSLGHLAKSQHSPRNLLQRIQSLSSHRSSNRSFEIAKKSCCDCVRSGEPPWGETNYLELSLLDEFREMEEYEI